MCVYIIYKYLYISPSDNPPPVILCYYESAATDDAHHLAVRQIPAARCTHIVYTFIRPAADGRLQPFADAATLAQLVALRSQTPQLRILAACGGWSAGSAVFSAIAADPLRRRRFARELEAFRRRHQLDGIDLAWLYPTRRAGSSEADRSNYAALLRELRAQLGDDRQLTVTVGADQDLLGTAYYALVIATIVSYINLAAYDEHNPAVGGRTEIDNYAGGDNIDPPIDAEELLYGWFRAGAPPAKILFGLAFFGRSYHVDAARPQQAHADAGGVRSYAEVCAELHGSGDWTTVNDGHYLSAYSYRAGEWLGYETPATLRAKVAYALQMRLAGVVVWTLNLDDADGRCGEGEWPLLRAVHEAAAVGGGRG